MWRAHRFLGFFFIIWLILWDADPITRPRTLKKPGLNDPFHRQKNKLSLSFLSQILQKEKVFPFVFSDYNRNFCVYAFRFISDLFPAMTVSDSGFDWFFVFLYVQFYQRSLGPFTELIIPVMIGSSLLQFLLKSSLIQE